MKFQFKIFLRLILTLTVFISCGPLPEDPNAFDYPLMNTKFRVIKLRGQEDNYFKPQGTKTIIIDIDSVTIDHQNYLERQGYPCHGTIKYSILQYDYESFTKELNRLGLLETEEESSTGYDIFTPYDDPDAGAFGQGDTTVEAIEVQKAYFIGEEIENSLNAACQDNYEKDHYFHVNFYKNGDMEYFDYNRKLVLFNRPIN